MGRASSRFVALFCVAAAFLAVSIPGRANPSAKPMGFDDARHLLGRAAFGGSPREIAELAQLSRSAAVDRLLQAGQSAALTPPPAWTREPLTGPRVLREASVEERRLWLQDQARRTLELRGWWIAEMLATGTPLLERMTLFWHNHFVTSQAKVRQARYLYDQNVLFRRNALGRFDELLHAAAKDPAMILYLDSATNRKDRPNENFAREVMELFTLGQGFYSETDIREAARAFTGWGLDADSGEFRFRKVWHDDGQKTVLGATGAFDGDQMLDVLLAQPLTAEFIVRKLWREFVSPEPDAGEVTRIASRFRASRYEIATALRELLLSKAFWARENRGVLVKSPVDLVVGTVRQFSIEVPDATPLAVAASQLGQVLFAPPNVKGWPGGEAWINSATLLARKQFLERLFRADEMPRAAGAPVMRGGEDMGGRLRGAAPGQALPAPAIARAEIQRAFDAIYFDGARWLGELKAAEGLAPQRVVLPIDAVAPLPADFAGRRQIKRLVLDASYQLK